MQVLLYSESSTYARMALYLHRGVAGQRRQAWRIGGGGRTTSNWYGPEATLRHKSPLGSLGQLWRLPQPEWAVGGPMVIMPVHNATRVRIP